MDLKITPLMKEIFNDQHKFKVVVGGRRFGKTMLGLMWLISGNLLEGQRLWYIMNTYRQGKMVAFPILKRILQSIPSATINESNLSCMVSGVEIAIKGSEDSSKLRGSHLNRVVLDEYAYMKPNVWEEVIYPMTTTDPDSEAMFIGTPDGFGNGFYDLFLKGQGNDPDWKSWQYTTLDGGWVEEEEINRAKRTMDERTFKQEFEASFESAQNRCAYNFDMKEHLKPTNGHTGQLFAGIDFNVSKMACVIGYEFTDGTVHYFDEICLKNSNTEEMARVLRQKYPDLIHIYPDPAGKNRSTTSNFSDHQILREFNFRIKARKKHPSHKDRLASLNRKLKDAEGNIKMTVDPKCNELIKDLDQCVRDRSGGIDKKDDARTHFLDACSYFLEYKFPVTISRAYSVQW